MIVELYTRIASTSRNTNGTNSLLVSFRFVRSLLFRRQFNTRYFDNNRPFIHHRDTSDKISFDVIDPPPPPSPLYFTRGGKNLLEEEEEKAEETDRKKKDANSRSRSRRGSSPPIPSTLSTSTSCQSRPSPCHPSTAHPNAPLGAGLCIFNKFRECSKPAISGGGCSEGGFSAASQTVSSRLFMCEAFAILSVPHRPPPYQRPRPHLSHSFSLSRLPFSLFLLIPSLRESSSAG